jgi:phospholipase C
MSRRIATSPPRRAESTLARRLAALVGVLAVAALAVAPVALAADPSARPSGAPVSPSVPQSAPAGASPSGGASASAVPSGVPSAGAPSASGSTVKPNTPIEHLVVLMQENHTFDNYFGTYPGADGIPADVCMPIDPSNTALGCVKPHHLTSHRTIDLNHGSDVATLVENGGKYDNFVLAQNRRNLPGEVAMGYYDGSDLPFYWNLAANYVLGDRFFSSDVGGSRENHMFWVAGQGGGGQVPTKGYTFDTIFDRLQAAGVSWKFYVQNYDPGINYRTLTGDAQDSQTIWVPLVDFDRFIDNPTLNKGIVDISEYRRDLANGTLPAVSFMVPSGASEHPPGDVSIGQVYGASQVTALIQSSSWPTSAFVLTWDDWGGWYDHVIPPRVDANGYGLRVPALFVSPFSTAGKIDSTTYDFTSILRFIEDNWDIQPLTARDASANSIAAAFDFTSSKGSPRLPEPTYPSDVAVSPSARLALIAVYGLIVVGVPVGGFFAWRRRPAAVRPARTFGAQPALGAGGTARAVPPSLTASAVAALAATTIGASGPRTGEAGSGRLLRRIPVTAPGPARRRLVDPPAIIPTRGVRTAASAARPEPDAGSAARSAPPPAPAPAQGPVGRRPTRVVTAAAVAAEPGTPQRTRKASLPASGAPDAHPATGPAPSLNAPAKPRRSRAAATTPPPSDTGVPKTRSASKGSATLEPTKEPAAKPARRGAAGTPPLPAQPPAKSPKKRSRAIAAAEAPVDSPAPPKTPRRRATSAGSALVFQSDSPEPDAPHVGDALDNTPPETAESRSGGTAGQRNRSPKTTTPSKPTRRRTSRSPEDPN